MFDIAQSPVRYDGWTIHVTRLHGVCAELFDAPTRTVLVDATHCEPRLAVAHALAHLALRHHLHGARDAFTDAQEAAADTYARVRLSGGDPAWVLPAA